MAARRTGRWQTQRRPSSSARCCLLRLLLASCRLRTGTWQSMAARSDGAVADAEETLIFGAVLPPPLAPGQFRLRTGAWQSMAARRTRAVADADETLIFGAVLPPSLAPGQLPLANGDLAVNGSTPHEGRWQTQRRPLSSARRCLFRLILASCRLRTGTGSQWQHGRTTGR